METIFQTGPGFFAANTAETRPEVPKGKLRVYCVRLEAYDLDDSEDDLDTSFSVLFAKAEGDPQIARTLLTLGETIKGNEAMLRKEAGI